MKPFDALRADSELNRLARPIALRKCTSRAEAPASSKESALLTPEQRANVAEKKRFEKLVLDVLGEDDENGERVPPAVRELALFFGVKRTKLHERMRFKRTDLAPLPEWFQKLTDYAEFERLAAEFLRTA